MAYWLSPLFPSSQKSGAGLYSNGFVAGRVAELFGELVLHSRLNTAFSPLTEFPARPRRVHCALCPTWKSRPYMVAEVGEANWTGGSQDWS